MIQIPWAKTLLPIDRSKWAEVEVGSTRDHRDNVHTVHVKQLTTLAIISQIQFIKQLSLDLRKRFQLDFGNLASLSRISLF